MSKSIKDFQPDGCTTRLIAKDITSSAAVRLRTQSRNSTNPIHTDLPPTLQQESLSKVPTIKRNTMKHIISKPNPLSKPLAHLQSTLERKNVVNSTETLPGTFNRLESGAAAAGLKNSVKASKVSTLRTLIKDAAKANSVRETCTSGQDKDDKFKDFNKKVAQMVLGGETLESDTDLGSDKKATFDQYNITEANIRVEKDNQRSLKSKVAKEQESLSLQPDSEAENKLNETCQDNNAVSYQVHLANAKKLRADKRLKKILDTKEDEPFTDKGYPKRVKQTTKERATGADLIKQPINLGPCLICLDTVIDKLMNESKKEQKKQIHLINKQSEVQDQIKTKTAGDSVETMNELKNTFIKKKPRMLDFKKIDIDLLKDVDLSLGLQKPIISNDKDNKIEKQTQKQATETKDSACELKLGINFEKVEKELEITDSKSVAAGVATKKAFENKSLKQVDPLKMYTNDNWISKF